MCKLFYGEIMEIIKQVLDANTPASEVYGMRLKNNRKIYPFPHTHTYCEFTIMISGMVRQKCNNSFFDLSPKQLCFVRDADIHTSICLNCEEAVFYNIGIPSTHLNNVAQYYGYPLDKLFKPKMPIVIDLRQKDYDNILRKIELFEKTDFGDIHALRSQNLLNELFFLIVSPTNPHIHIAYSKKTPAFLLELLVKMDDPQNFIPGLKRLWDLSDYSHEYLTRCFKKYLKVTPTEYINALRLNYAKKLIIENSVPITDACFHCGFNSLSYFYKQFKKLFGCTPKEMLDRINDINGI